MYGRTFFDRRAFLRSSLISLTALHLWPRTGASREGKGYLAAPTMQIAADRRSTIFNWVDLDAGKLNEILIPLRTPHSFTPMPASSAVGLVAESGGRGFCWLDLRQNKVTKTGTLENEKQILGGHSAISPDGLTIFLTQFSEADGTGSVSVRDAATFKEIRTIPTHGLFPHEVYVRDHGKHLMVANLGEPALTLNLVAAADGKIIDQTFFRSGEAVARNADLIPEPYRDEASYLLTMFQAAYSKVNRKILIHPHAKAMSFWNAVNEPSKWLSFAPLQPIVWSVTSDKSHLAVVLSDNSLKFLEMVSWKENSKFCKITKMRASTHMYAGNSWS